MKKILILGVLAFIFVLSLGFVFAAENKSNEKNNSLLNKSVVGDNLNKTAKNMTYGQCVSDFAKIKNQCYADAKNLSSDCGGKDLKNMSKTENEVCKADVKNAVNQCKKEFKAAKQECKKIKHNFFETMSVMFK